MTHKSGVSTILIVLIIMMLALLILTAIQSSFLLSIQRGKSASDSAKSLYASESAVNDIVARIIAGHVVDSTTIIVGEATITVQKSVSADTPPIISYTIISTLPNASNTIVVNTQTQPAITAGVSIVFVLDSSNSMGGTDVCINPPSCTEYIPRFQALKEAVVSFLQPFADPSSELYNKSNVEIGISQYRNSASWVLDSSNNPLDFEAMTEAGATYLINMVNWGFAGPYPYPVRTQVFGNTSTGTGVFFGMDQLLDSANHSQKVLILITDGQPETRTPDPQSRCQVSPLTISYPDLNQPPPPMPIHPYVDTRTITIDRSYCADQVNYCYPSTQQPQNPNWLCFDDPDLTNNYLLAGGKKYPQDRDTAVGPGTPTPAPAQGYYFFPKFCSKGFPSVDPIPYPTLGPLGPAFEFTRCALEYSNNKDIDNYVLTFDSAGPDTYPQAKVIFTDASLVKNYYTNSDFTQLQANLLSILSQVQQQITTVAINPSPTP